MEGLANPAARRLRTVGVFLSVAVGLFLSDQIPAPAITSQDFASTGQTNYLPSQCGTANPPVVLAGGPGGTGNFIRLVAATDSGTNTIAFDRSDAGAFTQITVDFDFRMNPGTGRGEGMGFAVLSTAMNGNTGALCGQAEEPNFPASLGVGFDIQSDGTADPNDTNSHISVHFNSALLQRFDTTPIVDLASNQWIHARIVARPGGGHSDVSVSLTPFGGATTALVSNFSVPELLPYESRAYFAARTSTQTADHDVANIQIQYAADPSVVGQWSPTVTPLPIVPIHSHYLPTGKVLCWDRLWFGQTDSIPRLLDPINLTWTQTPDPGLELFCSGHTFLPDGRLFVAGGHKVNDGFGLDTSFTYDPVANVWTPMAVMNAGRWYPCVVLLGSGDAVVLSGSITPGVINAVPQVMQFATGTWRDLTGASRNLPLYPRLHLAPNGVIFNSGPNQDSGYLDTSGTGAWTLTNQSSIAMRDYGSSVLYDQGKILIVGGANPPTATAEVIDLNVATPLWRSVAPMSYARRQLNALLLPDGKILITGGTSSPDFNTCLGTVQAAELWDPQTEKWQVLSAANVPRQYHSETILLPDGRVLSQGGGHPAPNDFGGTDEFNAEYFSPPYLFQGPRPSITSVQAQITMGQNFSVVTPDGASVTAVTLIPLTSVTHAFNMNQRILRPIFSVAAGGLTVTAPSDVNLCPPGYYWLFILSSGVPSVGQMVCLVPNRPPVANAGANASAEATGPTGASVTLNGTASSDPDNNITSYQWSEGVTPLATGPSAIVTLGVGVHSIKLTVTDAGGLQSTSMVTVTITDTAAPVIQTLGASPALLRSVTNLLTSVTLSATAVDVVDPTPVTQVISVASNEATSGLGPGDLTPDWQITGPMTVNLRSERFTYLRRYTITVQSTDASFNSSTRTVDVRVRGKWFP